uniref:palmitoyl-acyl carrier protein thioesterase, chloroplastic-like n=1 Tax=Fragaria vesca subsp. vesca TaxID=101020 RepID=UPI0005C988D4|nr:PREDICTED: palmitoyl-acyl carrier protein thioesterase, chloroplastic-like [Fragaria vesca subsp. vesca]
MNMHTRRLSKVEPDIRDEIGILFIVGDPQIDIKNTKLRQMDVNARSLVPLAGLKPSWTDLDINQHVSHVKYLDWVFQSLPRSDVEKNELSSMILEFRRECRIGDNLQSFCEVARSDGTLSQFTDKNGIEFDHLLLHEDGSTILRGKTMWKAR